MIDPPRKEHSAQTEMRDLFEDIVQTRAILNQLKGTPSLSRRKEKGRLNSSLDRKVKKFKQMRLTYLESVLTMENAALSNMLDKAVAELGFCKSKGMEQSLSEGLVGQIDAVLEGAVSGDVKGFFARSIGIADHGVIEDQENQQQEG